MFIETVDKSSLVVICLNLSSELSSSVQFESLLVEASVNAYGRSLPGLENFLCESTAMNKGLLMWQIRRLRALTLFWLGRRISVSEMAEVCGLSSGHFARAFKASYGETPYRYSVNIRLNMAKDIGFRSALPINDVASAAGFVDQSHLNKWFKRMFRSSFGTWRRKTERLSANPINN